MTASNAIDDESLDDPACRAALEGTADPGLLLRKYAAMRRSPFSYMRGACQLFYSTLPALGVISEVPPVWLCGDLHVENFGTYKGDNRLTYFDVVDFDQAARGPLTFDLIRFLASIRVGAGEWGVSISGIDGLLERALVAYANELKLGKPSWIERESARGMVKRLFAQVAGRSRSELLGRYSTKKSKRRRLVIDEQHLIAATSADRARVELMMATIGDTARDGDYFHVVDVSRRIAGVGSVGLPRYMVLVEGRGSPDRNVLLDVKLARPSAVAVAIPKSEAQEVWNTDAERVVSVQRHCSVVAPAFLFNAQCEGTGYCIRELQPDDDRVRLHDWGKQPKKIAEAIVSMASVAAWMHLRGGGWLGAAPAEQLSAFGHEDSWRRPILEISRDAANRIEREYLEFVKAYDDGSIQNQPLAG